MSGRRVWALGLGVVLAWAGGCGDDGGEPAGGRDGGPDGGPDAGDLCATVDCSRLDDACGVGSCDPEIGCVREPRPEGSACDDEDACTTDDVCTAGACAGAPLNCAGLGDDCNVGVCDPVLGCVADPVTDGTTCDDADPCTDGDACVDGACVGDAVDCADLGDACNAGVCDPETGDCALVPVMDGTACDDAVLCTGDGVCFEGACLEGDPVDCSGIAGTCGVGSCDPETGECVVEPAMDGAVCDDGFACTSGDACLDGGCVGDATECGGALYSEGFEDGPGDWRSGGTDSSWEHGVPAGAFIDAAASGTQAWVTNLDGDYVDDEDSYLESPSFDFSGLSDDPVLRFRHIFEIEASFGTSDYDETFVQVSTDGGASWTKVGTATSTTGYNWYNDDGFDWWDDVSGPPGVWRIASHELTGTAGFTDVRIRFVFRSDISVVFEGVGVDDVQLLADTNDDLAVDAITPPAPGCGSTTSGALSMRIANLGGVAVSDFDVSYTGPGGTTVSEAITDTVPAYGFLDHTFGTSISVSGTAASYTVEVDATDDPVAANDSASILVPAGLGLGTVALGTGYSEGFETDAGDWVASGTASSWARGAPSGTLIDAAAAGTYAWVTNPSGDYNDGELSYLTTDFCFDFSGETSDPELSFQHLFTTESCCDEGWVEVSTDAGARWTKLGTSATGTNWYNDTFNDWWDGTSDADGDWREASHVLTGTAGEDEVRIRFVFRSDPSITEEGFGVDSVAVDPAP